MIDTQINTLVRIIADMSDPSDGSQLPDDTIALIAQGLKLIELVEKFIKSNDIRHDELTINMLECALEESKK